MATGIAPVSISVSAGIGKHLKPCNLSSPFPQMPILRMQRNFLRRGTTPNFSIRAEYKYRRGVSGGDFAAGFLLGGAIFGTLAYVFAPQIRRSLLNENEHGFRRARGPIYYDEGLEGPRHTLNEKIRQLNSAIDNVSSRLRGGKNMPPVPVETDPEEATM